jgi:hypothetical protein
MRLLSSASKIGNKTWGDPVVVLLEKPLSFYSGSCRLWYMDERQFVVCSSRFEVYPSPHVCASVGRKGDEVHMHLTC